MLPPTSGVTVHCGVKESQEAKFITGSERIWWGFGSTTFMLSRVLESPQFLGKIGPSTIFSIEAAHAYDISRFSAAPSEAELLLAPHTQLVVRDVLDCGGGLVIVHMRQLPYLPLVIV